MNHSDLMKRLPTFEFYPDFEPVPAWGTHYTQYPTTAGNLAYLCQIWDRLPWGWSDSVPYPVKNIMGLLDQRLRNRVQPEPFHQEWSCSWHTTFNAWNFTCSLPLIMHDAWVTHLYHAGSDGTTTDADLAFDIICLDRQLRSDMARDYVRSWNEALLTAKLATREELANA